MAAKCTIARLVDAGFRQEQFGTPADFATAGTGYLARVLADVSAWARERFGAAAYDALAVDTDATYIRLAEAEKYKAAAELWRRRVGFLDANAMQGREGLAYLTQRECYAHAQQCDDMAEEFLQAAINGPDNTPGSLIAVGIVETGRFPPVVDGAVTA